MSWREKPWTVVLLCTSIMFLVQSVGRLGGMFFVEAVLRYGIGRDAASFPFTLNAIVKNLAGPLAGYCGTRFGLKLVTVLGCGLSAVGIAGCFFSEEVYSMAALFGVLYGVGSSFGIFLLPSILSLHCEGNLSMAIGIHTAGYHLGSLVMPVVCDRLLQAFGLSGTLLVVGAIVLNGVPVAMLLPAYRSKRRSSGQCDGERNEEASGTGNGTKTDSVYSIRAIKTTAHENVGRCYVNSAVDSEDKAENNAQSLALLLLSTSVKGGAETNEKLVLPSIPNNSKKQLVENSNDVKENYVLSETNDYSKFDFENENKSPGSCSSKDSQKCIDNIDNTSVSKPPSPSEVEKQLARQHPELESPKEIENTPEANARQQLESNFARTGQSSEPPSGTTSNSFRVFAHPTFLLIALYTGFFNFISLVIRTVIIDYARDKGTVDSQDKYFLMCLSASDLVSCFTLGWLADSGWMTVTTFNLLSCAGSAVTSAAFVWASGFVPLMAVLFAFYFVSCGLFITRPAMIKEHIRPEYHTMAMASSHVLSTPFNLAASPLIGFFRESLGSYDGLFYLSAAVSLLCCGLVLLVPCSTRRKAEAH